jgi:hypothetical protein
MIGEMSMMVVLGICIGVAATVTMDVLGSAARKVGLVAGAKGIWVGRWYLGIARGRLVHSNIAAAPEQPGEKRAALVGHFVIGVVLAIVYVLGARRVGVSPSSFVAALGYGLATCVFPWFLMYPALGFGVLGLKGPAEMKPFRSSVLNHLFYGFGLWWSATVLGLG